MVRIGMPYDAFTMTNVSKRIGGQPFDAGTYVSVDGVTIQGSGSYRNPLRAVGQGAPVVQRIVVGSGTIDPTIETTIVSAPGTSVPYALALADGQTDGFEKTILLQNIGVIAAVAYELTPVSLMSYTTIDIPPAGGSIKLVWNATLGKWMGEGGLNSTWNP